MLTSLIVNFVMVYFFLDKIELSLLIFPQKKILN